MSCPRCHQNSLTPKTAHGATAYACTRCAGLWIDIASATRIAHAALESATPAAAEHLPCPTCRQEMGSWKARGVVFDRCDAHGLWFDHTELDRILSTRNVQPDADADSTATVVEGVGLAVFAIFDIFS